jgi:uncharacterized membrane protein
VFSKFQDATPGAILHGNWQAIHKRQDAFDPGIDQSGFVVSVVGWSVLVFDFLVVTYALCLGLFLVTIAIPTELF